MKTSVANLYGVDTVTKMQAVIDRMYSTGYMAASQSSGSFAGSNVQLTTAYAIDRSGNVFRFTENGSQSLGTAQQVATGWNDARALLPGGGGVFYTVSNSGVLAWRSFDNITSTAAKPGVPQGPIQLSTNFGKYATVFGGSDGVIYAVGPDGSLSWYRHTNLTAGGGPAYLTGPKIVGSGWGQYKQLFSAGSGVIYAVQPDGTLLWFRHKDYLTGDSMDAPASTQPALAAALQKRALSPQAHWDGPVKVNSGWSGLQTAQAGPNGVILAVKTDGSVLWYQYANYLTAGTAATSTLQTMSAQPTPASMTAATASPNWGAPSSLSASTSHIASLARPVMAPGPVASLPANARTTQTSLGAAQSAPLAPISATSAAAGLPVNGWQGPKSVGSGWQQYPLVSLTLYTTANPVLK